MKILALVLCFVQYSFSFKYDRFYSQRTVKLEKLNKALNAIIEEFVTINAFLPAGMDTGEAATLADDFLSTDGQLSKHSVTIECGQRPVRRHLTSPLLIFADEMSSVVSFLQSRAENRRLASSIRNNLLLIVLTTPSSTDIYSTMLQQLWEDFKILNSLLLLLDNDTVLAYNPFIEADEGWRGVLQEWRLTEARKMLSKRTQNLHLSPITVSMFPRYPTAIPYFANGSRQYNEKGGPIDHYGGIDGLILYHLSQYMNFSPVYEKPLDGKEYGYVKDTFSGTGVLGDLLTGRAELAFNSMFYKDYHTRNIEFTCTVYSDTVCLIVPKAQASSKTIALMMQTDVQMYVFTTYAITALLWYLLSRFRHAYISDCRKKLDISTTFLENFHPLTSSAMSRFPDEVPLRIFVFSVIIFYSIINNFVQGQMVKVLSKPQSGHDISTLRELDESGLPISTTSPNLANVLGSNDPSQNLVTAHLISKIRVIEGGFGEDTASDRVAFRRDTAALVRVSDVTFGVYDKYRTIEGQPMLHVVQECPMTYMLGYIVPKGSPFLKEINDFILKVLEIGLIEKWWRSEAKPSTCKSESKDKQSDVFRVFTFKDFQVYFAILAIGLLSGLIIFTIEKITGTINNLYMNTISK